MDIIKELVSIYEKNDNLDEFYSAYCDFISGALGFRNVAIYSADPQGKLTFLGKSKDSVQELLNNLHVNCSLCEFLQTKEQDMQYYNPFCPIKISESELQQLCFKIENGCDKYVLVVAKENDFDESDRESLKKAAGLFSILFNKKSAAEVQSFGLEPVFLNSFTSYTSIIQTVIGSIVFLKNEVSPIYMNDLVTNIYNNTYNLLIALNEQKEFTRNLLTKIDIANEEINLVNLLPNVISYVSEKFNSRNAEIIFNTEISEAVIFSDRAKIQFIIEKLLSVVLKYSNSPTISVRIVGKDNIFEQLQISTQSLNLPNSIFDKIFEPGILPTINDNKINGLSDYSLPILAQYLKALDKNVVFSRANDSLSVVRFEFNKQYSIQEKFSKSLKPSSENLKVDEAKEMTQMHLVEEVAEPVKTKTYKILLAEDYKHSQIIVTRLLKKNSFEDVVAVENGQEALDAATKEQFDLILMDMQMPVMSGFEAIQEIRKMEHYKNIPIIALTAFAMKGDKEKCIEAGASDYIPKPIDSKELIDKIKTNLNLQ